MKTYWTTTNNIKHIYLITLKNTSITAVSRSLAFMFRVDSMHGAADVDAEHTCKSPKKWNILIPFTIPSQHSILIMEMFLFARLLQSPDWWMEVVRSASAPLTNTSEHTAKRVTEEILIIPWNSILINFLLVQTSASIERESFRCETNGKTYYI